MKTSYWVNQNLPFIGLTVASETTAAFDNLYITEISTQPLTKPVAR